MRYSPPPSRVIRRNRLDEIGVSSAFLHISNERGGGEAAARQALQLQLLHLWVVAGN